MVEGSERPVTLRRLHNEDWGFDSNCFVCEPRNDGGLQIPFHHDTVLPQVSRPATRRPSTPRGARACWSGRSVLRPRTAPLPQAVPGP